MAENKEDKAVVDENKVEIKSQVLETSILATIFQTMLGSTISFLTWKLLGWFWKDPKKEEASEQPSDNKNDEKEAKLDHADEG